MQKKVLLIEDDPTCEILLRRMIEAVTPGTQVTCENTAEKAWQDMEAESKALRAYDLVVADIFLAGKNTGLDFWQTCRNRFPDTPILLTSSLPLLQFFEAVGPNDVAPRYVAKPIVPREFKQALESMLAS